MFRFGIKAGLVASAVYVTIDYGVWSDSETTTELYYNIRNELTPYVKPVVDQIPFDVPRLPKSGDLCSSMKSAWNKGVMATSLFLAESGDKAWYHASNGIKYGYEKIREQLDPPEESKT